VLGIKKDPCRLAREGVNQIRATLRLFINKLPTNATVKVNLIKFSIAGRGGFVKADIDCSARSGDFSRLQQTNTTEVVTTVTTKLFFPALTFLPFQHDIELQLLLADHLLDAAAIFFFVGGCQPFLERGNIIQQVNLR